MNRDRSSLPSTDPRSPVPDPRRKKKSISFADELWISAGSRADWPYFARWHYRSHNLGLVHFVTILWHADEPVGICIFISPPMSLRPRNRYFGLSGKWDRTRIRSLNRQLVMLSRVVIHPTYRGAGLASRFVRRSCELCGWPWIETLAQMGHINPFFERAGFIRAGRSRPRNASRSGHSSLWGGRKRGQAADNGKGLVTQQTFEKSRFAEPIYYVFDNRASCQARQTEISRPEGPQASSEEEAGREGDIEA